VRVSDATVTSEHAQTETTRPESQGSIRVADTRCMIKKLITVLVSASLIALVATPALASDDAQTDRRTAVEEVSVDRRPIEGDAKVNLRTKRTAAILEGDTAWVAISWQAKRTDATDFRIVAKTETAGVAISYPENTGTYSSLMDNDTLSAGEIDFTSLKISVPYGIRGLTLTVNATWVDGEGKQEKDFKVRVPVARFRGDDIAQVTTDAGSVTTSDPGWLGVEWTGIAPTLDDVEMIVTGPAGSVITYPADRSFTSLYYDNTLEDGETDVARFLVDAAAVRPGTYTVDVVLTYTKSGKPASVTGQASFEITG